MTNRPDFFDMELYVSQHVPYSAIRSIFSRKYQFLAHRMHVGRPNWSALFEEWQTVYQRKKVAVYCCGPTPLNREIRRHCYNAMLAGHKFTFHKESFMWKAKQFYWDRLATASHKTDYAQNLLGARIIVHKGVFSRCAEVVQHVIVSVIVIHKTVDTLFRGHRRCCIMYLKVTMLLLASVHNVIYINDWQCDLWHFCGEYVWNSDSVVDTPELLNSFWTMSIKTDQTTWQALCALCAGTCRQDMRSVVWKGARYPETLGLSCTVWKRKIKIRDNAVCLYSKKLLICCS